MFTTDLKFLEEVTKRTQKEVILNGAHETTWELLRLALDPYIIFGVKKLPEANPGLTRLGAEQSYQLFLDLTNALSTRAVTGTEAKDAIACVLGLCHKTHEPWFRRILMKNPRVGVDAKTLNKLRPGYIKQFEVMLAKDANLDRSNRKILEDIKYPVWTDVKLDGIRTIAILRNGVCTLYTREAHVIATIPHINKAIEKLGNESIVLDGEAMGSNWNETQSLISSTKNIKDASAIKYYVFDAVAVDEWDAKECKTAYADRLLVVRDVLAAIDSLSVQPVAGQECSNEEEVWKAYDGATANGDEGLMVKDLSAVYPFKRSACCLKMKPKQTVDGVIIGWDVGDTNTKFENMFGAFRVRLGSGSTEESMANIVSVGGGYTEAQRDEFYNAPGGPSSYIGRVMEIECQEVTKDGKLRFPVFKRFRMPEDKNM